MKLLRLLMIMLLLQPCPVCWGHGIAEHSEPAQHQQLICQMVTNHCSCCTHLEQITGVQNQPHHDEHDHDCPCSCHASEQVFAPTTSAVHLRSYTTPALDMVCHEQSWRSSAVQHTVSLDTSQTPLTVPLRL